MNRLSQLHPLLVIAIFCTVTAVVGLLTHDFWLMLIVSAVGMPVLRRAARSRA